MSDFNASSFIPRKQKILINNMHYLSNNIFCQPEYLPLKSDLSTKNNSKNLLLRHFDTEKKKNPSEQLPELRQISEKKRVSNGKINSSYGDNYKNYYNKDYSEMKIQNDKIAESIKWRNRGLDMNSPFRIQNKSFVDLNTNLILSEIPQPKASNQNSNINNNIEQFKKRDSRPLSGIDLNQNQLKIEEKNSHLSIEKQANIDLSNKAVSIEGRALSIAESNMEQVNRINLNELKPTEITRFREISNKSMIGEKSDNKRAASANHGRIIKNDEFYDKNIAFQKEKLLMKLKKQQELQDLYINKVKDKEEEKLKNINQIIDRTILDRQNKEKIDLEERRNVKKQMNDMHFKLLAKQIKDKKSLIDNEKLEIKNLVNSRINELNEFNNEMREKDIIIKNFYKNSLNDQIMYSKNNNKK